MKGHDKTLKILGILLVVQIGLAAATWLGAGGGGGGGARALLGLDEKAVTALEITARPTEPGKEAESVRLVRQGDGWIVASAGDYPAKADKVDEVVRKLVDLQVKSPIATQAANHNALRVGKDTYAKEVAVTAGSETRKLVVGSGSGTSVHVRMGDKDEVYQGRGLSEWTLSASVRTYVDPAYVDVPAEKLQTVTARNEKGTLTFHQVDGKWTLEQLPPGKELDAAQATSFVNAVARVTLERPVGKTVEPAHGLSDGVVVTLVSRDGDAEKTTRYVVGAKAGSDEYAGYYVKADEREYVVVASKWGTESARTKAAADFVKSAEQAPAAAAPPGFDFE